MSDDEDYDDFGAVSPVQFQSFPKIRQQGNDARHEYFRRGDTHEVWAYRGGEKVGQLSWHHNPGNFNEAGEIDHVGVHEDHQRTGVASGMWAAARAYSDLSAGSIPAPKHSLIRTDDGDKWAQSVSPRRSVPGSGG